MSTETLIWKDVIAGQPPVARAIIRMLLAMIAELEARLDQSPRISSLPLGTEYPRAKPIAAKSQPNKKPGRQP